MLAENPDLVIQGRGINDLRGSGFGGAALTVAQYRQNLDAYVRTVRSSGIEMILLTPTPIRDITNNYHQRLQIFSEAALEVAARHGIYGINLQAELWAYISNKRVSLVDLLPDNVHFADAKYAWLAEILFGRLLSGSSSTRMLRVGAQAETRISVFQSPYWVHDGMGTFTSSGQFDKSALYMRGNGAQGTTAAMEFYVDAPGLDLVLVSARGRGGGIATFKLDGVACPAINFHSPETYVVEAEAVLASNLPVGYHKLSLVNTDIALGSGGSGDGGQAYVEAIVFRRSVSAPIAERVYAVASGGTPGSVIQMRRVLEGPASFYNGVDLNRTGVLFLDRPQAALRTGQTLHLEVDWETMYAGCGFSWFGNLAYEDSAGLLPGQANTGYLLYIDPTTQYLGLYAAGRYNALSGTEKIAEYTTLVNVGISHKIHVVHTAAGLIKAYLDGVEVISVTNTAHRSGWFGLFAYKTGTQRVSRFDYAVV